MRELRINTEGKSYVYQLPENYAEMDERQYRAAMLKMMHMSEVSTFWESFVGIPHRFFGSLPEWVLHEMDKMLEFIPKLDERIDRFFFERLPIRGTLRKSRFIAPEPMLGNMSLQQFMTTDNFFSYYTVTQREAFIDRMIASLYLKPHETFVIEDKKDRLVPLEERSHYIHNHVTVEVRFGVFVNWIFIKNWLSKAFPHLFKRGKSDGKPQASDWLPLFDSFVGDNIPFIKDYQRMLCMDAFRIIDGKIKQQEALKK